MINLSFKEEMFARLSTFEKHAFTLLYHDSQEHQDDSPLEIIGLIDVKEPKAEVKKIKFSNGRPSTFLKGTKFAVKWGNPDIPCLLDESTIRSLNFCDADHILVQLQDWKKKNQLVQPYPVSDVPRSVRFARFLYDNAITTNLSIHMIYVSKYATNGPMYKGVYVDNVYEIQWDGFGMPDKLRLKDILHVYDNELTDDQYYWISTADTKKRKRKAK